MHINYLQHSAASFENVHVLCLYCVHAKIASWAPERLWRQIQQHTVLNHCQAWLMKQPGLRTAKKVLQS